MPQTAKIDELYDKIESMLSKIEAGNNHKTVIGAEMSSMDDHELKEFVITMNRYISEISGDESVLSIMSGNIEDVVDTLESILDLIGKTKGSNLGEHSTTAVIPHNSEYTRPHSPSLTDVSDIKKDIKDGIAEGLAESYSSHSLKEAVSGTSNVYNQSHISSIANSTLTSSNNETGINNTSNRNQTNNIANSTNSLNNTHIEGARTEPIQQAAQPEPKLVTIPADVISNISRESASDSSTLIIKEYLDRCIENNKINNIESQIVNDIQKSKESTVKLVNNNNLKHVSDMHERLVSQQTSGDASSKLGGLPTVSDDKTDRQTSVVAGQPPLYVSSYEYNDHPAAVGNRNEYNNNVSPSYVAGSPISSSSIKNITEEYSSTSSSASTYNAMSSSPTTISNIDASINGDKKISYSEFDKNDAIPKDVNISLTGVETRLDSMIEYLKNKLATDIATAVKKSMPVATLPSGQLEYVSASTGSPSYEPGSMVGSK